MHTHGHGSSNELPCITERQCVTPEYRYDAESTIQMLRQLVLNIVILIPRLEVIEMCYNGVKSKQVLQLTESTTPANSNEDENRGEEDRTSDLVIPPLSEIDTNEVHALPTPFRNAILKRIEESKKNKCYHHHHSLLPLEMEN